MRTVDNGPSITGATLKAGTVSYAAVTMAALPDDQFSMEDLSEIYRVEKKTGSLSSVRRDLYRAMASLLIAQRGEYDRLLAKDPDSIMCEGANQRRRQASRLSKEIVEIRMGKICKMALRGAMGADNSVDLLTDEEKTYYSTVLKASKDHNAVLDRLSGDIRYHSPDLSPDESAKPEAAAPAPQPASVQVPAEPAPAAAPAVEPAAAADFPADFPAELPEDRPEEEPEILDDSLDPPSAAETDFNDAPAAAPAAPVSEMDEDTVLIRVTEDLPTFAGPERDYSLKKEDLVRMPKMMAQVLVNREKAVVVAPTP